MTYEQLVDFVQNRMRMSHVYQPVMLAVLLTHDGKCSTMEIARAILAHDESQVEYYENVTKYMVGRVLREHGIVERESDGYSLVVRPFDVQVDEEVVGDLRERLARTRWPDEVDAAGWDRGTNLAYMRELVGYWEDTFDWREQEARLNRFAHLHTEVDGFGLHFGNDGDRR